MSCYGCDDLSVCTYSWIGFKTKIYYSDKRGLYGYKAEFSILTNGCEIGYSDNFPGSTVDITTFSRKLVNTKKAFVILMLKKKRYMMTTSFSRNF